MWAELIPYILTGFASGILAGLLGLGGGLITVPALLWLMPGFVPEEIRIHIAVATSLAVMIPTACWSAWLHYRRQGLLWSVLLWLAPGLALGALIATSYAADIPSAGLEAGFALLAILASLNMIFGQLKVSIREGGHRLERLLTGMFIGSWSALAGVGGGTITVPYLVWRGVDMRKAVGVSAACGIPIAIAGVTGFGMSMPGAELLTPELKSRLLGFIYLPAWATVLVSSLLVIPLGARMTHFLPVTTLKKVLGVVLLFVAARILLV